MFKTEKTITDHNSYSDTIKIIIQKETKNKQSLYSYDQNIQSE